MEAADSRGVAIGWAGIVETFGPPSWTRPPGGPRYLLPFLPLHLAALRWPVVVVGAGAAGAAAALAAADAGAETLVLAKPPMGQSNTRWAQGGMAAAVGSVDSVEQHAADTLQVGCGLADPAVVAFITGQGPAVAERLVALGVRFDQGLASVGKQREMTLEGGHSVSRVLSAGGDSTGRAIQTALHDALAAHPRITVREDLRVVDLLVSDGRCVGALATATSGEMLTIAAGALVLATGAVGQIYRETTNPTVATGDGIAMAFRAGVILQDLEFVQFHPTTLYIAGAARVLISEAVRGAGAILIDREGVRVMDGKHPDLDLAPRDVVSRAILERMVETGDTHVYLDASRVPDVTRRFPGIARMCRGFGIDIATDPIPARPGAHYMIGGVRTGLDAATSMPGLLACGEVAATGLHGANRLASNSLLEAIVMGQVAGRAAADSHVTPDPGRFATLDDEPPVPIERESTDDPQLNLDDMLYSLKSLMWRQVGLVREAFPLEDAQEKIRFWENVLLSRPAPCAQPESSRFVDLANMLLVSRLTAAAALARTESRGTHWRVDYPDTNDAEWRRRVVVHRTPDESS